MATVPSGTSHILRLTRGKLCKLAADLADHVHNTEKETPMYSLLLVDDEEFALAALRHALPWEAYGFTDIRTASSSPDAWELLTTGRIDACFIDIRMPVMSGLELLARARRQNLETLFVVVSGYSDFSYAKQAIQHGVLDYCLKPVSEEECRPVLEKLARQIPLNRISPDSAFASRLLADPDFCRDFLSGLHAAPGPQLTLLLLRTPDLGRILLASDSLRPAKVLFLGEDEAFLIWTDSPNEDNFVSFLESWRQTALLIYGTAPPGSHIFPERFPASAHYLSFPEHRSHRRCKAPRGQ